MSKCQHTVFNSTCIYTLSMVFQTRGCFSASISLKGLKHSPVWKTINNLFIAVFLSNVNEIGSLMSYILFLLDWKKTRITRVAWYEKLSHKKIKAKFEKIAISKFTYNYQSVCKINVLWKNFASCIRYWRINANYDFSTKVIYFNQETWENPSEWLY